MTIISCHIAMSLSLNIFNVIGVNEMPIHSLITI